ncbi:hypothetical protein HWV62_17946 [Athelia sp. TMB]|nr:hypothetical protein HWV62_17946 [Athelia sp. TMB]
MSLLKVRGGEVHIRVGGNTQETASVVASLPNGTILEKGILNTGVATQTPELWITPDLLYMMNNISSLLGNGVKWYLGVPMNDTSNPRLQIAEDGERILGSNLLGLQVGNEPDLYGSHQLGGRPTTYDTQNYVTEFGQMMTAINNDMNIPVTNNIVGPSVTASGKNWTTDAIFALGYLTSYGKNLGFISVEKYPNENCASLYPGGNFGPVINPQDVLSTYTTHAAGLDLVADFTNTSAAAKAAGKPLLMFETNTASCGGFPGVSDSFASALWALDYGLTMAAAGFSGALLHVSGSTVYYNRLTLPHQPFTAPPTNQSTYRQWTISPIFYASLVMAEALGSSNTAQVVDLQANGFNNYTPAYGIYENGRPARVALFNYLTDTSGASTYTASIGINGGPGISQVKVKYLSASSITQKSNITWAGQVSTTWMPSIPNADCLRKFQGFGGVFESDGRLQGNISIQTVQCSNNICQIQVPAPGFALVSYTDTAFTETAVSPTAVPTYSTTTTTGWQFTNTGLRVDASVLATSNGHGGSGGGMMPDLGSTSRRSSEESGAERTRVASSLVAITAAVFGMMLVGHRAAL